MEGFAVCAIEASILSFIVDVNQPGPQLRRPDRTNPSALHDQVAASIRRAIADGEAHPGDRIPQARDLAAELGVNKNTVLRALRILREEGIIEMGRGRTIRVAADAHTSDLTARPKSSLPTPDTTATRLPSSCSSFSGSPEPGYRKKVAQSGAR